MEGRGRRTPPGPPGVVFVGREAELATLEELLDKALGGSSHFVVIEGEAGMGKTRLLDEILVHPGAADSFIYRARAEEVQPRPFGLLADALAIDASSPDPERRAVGQLLAADAGEASDKRYRVIEGVLNVIERQAIAGPVLVVLDDLHWADPSSAQALYVLSHRLAYLPVLVLLACRPLPRPPELARLVDNLAEMRGHHLRLEPLGEAPVSRLAASRLGADPGPALRDRLAGAAGNPLFVLELLDALSEEGIIEVQDGVADSTSAVEPPPSLRMTIVRRLAFLDPASLELLRNASVLGGSFSAGELSVVTGEPLLDVLTTLREPIASGFVTAAGERFAFRHDVVREALYLELPPAVRKGLHLHVGRSLAAAGASAAEVAPHLALGAEFGDQEAVARLRRAARELRSRAPGLAVQLLERAVSLVAPDDPDWVALVGDQIRMLAWAGRAREAEALAAGAVVEVTDPAAALQLSVQRLSVLVTQYRAREAEDLAERLLENPSLPPEVRAEVLALSAVSRAALGDVAGVWSRLAEARPFTDAHPASRPAALFWGLTVGTSHTLGFLWESIEGVEAMATVSQSSRQFGDLLILLGAFYVDVDRFDDALATLDRARTRLEQVGNVARMIEYHWYLANLHFVSGRWDDALAEIAASRQLTDETGTIGVRWFFGDPSPLIHLHRGDVPAGRHALATIEGESTAGPSTLIGFWTQPMRALIEQGAGDPVASFRTVVAWHETALGMAVLPESGRSTAPPAINYRGIGRALVRMCRAQGQKELAAQMAADAAEARRRANGVASLEGIALLLQGMVEEDPEALLAAVEAFRAAPRPFDRAEACAEAGVTLLGRGRDDEGRALLAQAFDLYDELGASRPEAALAQEVRAFGIRRGAKGRRQRALSGWSALTGTEERIVALVAQGLTNAEIGERLYISRGTVATHLRSVFRKLDVSSRAELAADVARRLA